MTLPPATIHIGAGASPANGYQFSGDGGAAPYVTNPFDLPAGWLLITADGKLPGLPPECPGPVPLTWRLYKTGDPANWPPLKTGEYRIGCGNSIGDQGVSLPEGGSFHLEITSSQPWVFAIEHVS